METIVGGRFGVFVFPFNFHHFIKKILEVGKLGFSDLLKVIQWQRQDLNFTFAES